MNRIMFNPMDDAPPLFVHFKREAPKGVLREGWAGVYIHVHKRTTPKIIKRAAKHYSKLHFDTRIRLSRQALSMARSRCNDPVRAAIVFHEPGLYNTCVPDVWLMY